jgi:three-Cys-motif partner protein
MVRAIAKTKALDMWWLFPISAVYRNAPHDQNDITPEKRGLVTKCMDDPNWERAFYQTKANPRSDQVSMFAEIEGDIGETTSRLTVAEIEALVTAKLKTLFPYVATPAPLRGHSRAQLFSLYFAVANPSGPAIAAASSIARDLLKQV